MHINCVLHVHVHCIYAFTTSQIEELRDEYLLKLKLKDGKNLTCKTLTSCTCTCTVYVNKKSPYSIITTRFQTKVFNCSFNSNWYTCQFNTTVVTVITDSRTKAIAVTVW